MREVVDLALAVIACDDLLLAGIVHIGKQRHHIAHRTLDVAKHRIEITVDLAIEVYMALMLAYKYLSGTQTAVGYTLSR